MSTTPQATPDQWTTAQEELDALGYYGRMLGTSGEIFEVLDSMANDENVIDNIEEYRMHDTATGRRMERME